jgi:hypothetical protein
MNKEWIVKGEEEIHKVSIKRKQAGSRRVKMG